MISPLPSAIRVIVADDHPTMRQGLQSLLSEIPRISVVGVAQSFSGLNDVLRQAAADVLILDVLGMGESALATVIGLRRDYPALKVVIFSSTLSHAPELLREGAQGYISKEEVFDDLVLAIMEVHAGRNFLSQNVREYVERTPRRYKFTTRQYIILRMNEEGKGTNEIAAYLRLALGTLRNNFSKLYEITDTTDRASLAAWYRRNRDLL